MQITIEITCPLCHRGNINRNGKKSNSKQNYVCKDCGRQFIAEQERTYNGCRKGIIGLIQMMLVRGIGIQDIGAVLKISLNKVLKVLKETRYKIKPRRSHYDALEIDEFWTYAGKKTNKVWLIYAYHRESGEIVSYVWSKRDLKTAKKLRKRINRLGITYNRIATDGWDSFLAAFAEDVQDVGKQYTVGMRVIIAGSVTVSGEFFGKPVVSQKDFSATGRLLIWPSSTSTMASSDTYHTF